MYFITRKSAPKVKNGQVQFKNRWDETSKDTSNSSAEVVIDRQKPGKGFRHLVHQADLRRFLEVLPDWDELRRGLDAIVLAPGDPGLMGWHRPGQVALTAWEREIVLTGFHEGFVIEHRGILEKLRVPCRRSGVDWTLEFSESSARAFQLVHVLIHELGHHRDRMTTRLQQDACRGEGFAEQYALQHEDEILDAYWRTFPEDY